MIEFDQAFSEVISHRKRPKDGSSGAEKKNYTEAMSHQVSRILAEELRRLGLTGTLAPTNSRDKSFMGGLAPKVLMFTYRTKNTGCC